MLPRMLVIFLLVSLTAWSAIISDFALGSQLAGAVVTVTRFGGAMNSATFIAAGTGASATAVGSASFTLMVSPGDTSGATWTLTNTDPTPIGLNNITAVTIDLTLSSLSLFDSGSSPSTPVSGPGIPGVIYLSGVAISGAAELAPWADPSNLGDMYKAVSITFGAFIGPGASSSWMDDTDVIGVPEPASIVLIAGGLLLIGRWQSRCARRHRTVHHADAHLPDCARPATRAEFL